MTPFGQPPAFRLEVEVCKPEPLDPASDGPVRLVSIRGGRVLGGLSGRILPGGADWQTVSSDGTIEIEARYLLELDDGTRLELQSRGRRSGRLGPFWSMIWLRSEAPDHSGLNSQQFLGSGQKLADIVAIECFELPEQGRGNLKRDGSC